MNLQQLKELRAEADMGESLLLTCGDYLNHAAADYFNQLHNADLIGYIEELEKKLASQKVAKNFGDVIKETSKDD